MLRLISTLDENRLDTLIDALQRSFAPTEETDDYGRKFVSRPALAASAVSEKLCTCGELVQRTEEGTGQNVLVHRLKAVLAAFTRVVVGAEDGRNIDVEEFLEYGFDNFVTDTKSRRYHKGQAVMVFCGKGGDTCLGESKSPPLLLALSHSLFLPLPVSAPPPLPDRSDRLHLPRRLCRRPLHHSGHQRQWRGRGTTCPAQ